MTRSIRHSVFLALVAAALLVRLVVPVGFMPVATGQGTIVTLCAGDSTVQRIDLGGKLPAKHQAADAPCAFAGIGGALDLPVPDIALAVPIAPVALPFGRAIADLVVHRLAAPPPPSQAPPASA